MKTIWKYTLRVDDRQEIKMPEDAKVLCVQNQGGVPQVWVEVDPASPLRGRRFRIHGTGHPIELSKDGANVYVGTFQIQGGTYVFHVFDDGVA